MFESVELGAEVAKDRYEAEVPDLRVDLVNLQFELRTAPFAVLIHLAGDDREGCEEAFDLLHEWMDPRELEGHAFERPSDEERERPRFWRYWRALPPAGRTGIHLGAWTMGAIGARVRGELGAARFERRIEHVRSFERALSENGILLLKFWLHLPPKERRRRLRRARQDPKRAWRVEEIEWDLLEDEEESFPVVEHLLRETSTAECPWNLVESTDPRHRNLLMGRTIREAVTTRLARPTPTDESTPTAALLPGRSVLDAVDLDRRLEKADYRKQRDALQERLGELSLLARAVGCSSLLVFEGWDAAGKGGTIRRLTGAMPARNYRVVHIAAPTDEERAHHYLWRFWRHLLRAGKMLVFDRSWYGRVLVERVEGLARTDEWRRAYGEIVDFEEQLVERGIVLLKFWLHITPEEQLRRFQERERTPYKKYKITRDDYRNHQQWPEYLSAVDEMVARTSTEFAPWHLVPAQDKRVARVEVLRTVCDALEEAVERAESGRKPRKAKRKKRG